VLVRDVMTSPAVTITALDEVAEAARVLDRLDLTSLPVVDEERRLLGVIGEADVIGQLSVSEDDRGQSDVPRVRDVMTYRVFTAGADDDLITVVALMSCSPQKSLPVLLHDRVVGVVSRRDVVRTMVRGELVPGAETAPA
jgi:CBS-domain-containing membrane protein